MVGGINPQRFSDFLREARQRPNADEHVVFIFYGAPAHCLSRYSPFLNIVEQGISALKAGIKADISRREIQAQMNARGEARKQGVALGEYRQRNIACQRNIGSITAHKCGQWYRFMQTYLARCLNGGTNRGIVYSV